MEAIVIGAGVGGLSTAVALRRVGVGVTILERSDELGEIGAGLSLWPNALCALRELGLYEAVMAVGNPLRPASELRTSSGEVLSSVPAERMDERFGEPAAAVHRADLQAVLLRAAEEAGVEIRTGVCLDGFEQSEAGVVARFQAPRTAGGMATERGGMLVGADGIRSTVRALMLADGEPRYAGYVAWRGVAYFREDRPGAGHAPTEPADPIRNGGGSEVWGVGQRFGLAKIGRPRAYWWYATKNAPEPRAEEGTDEPARPERREDELLALFGGWADPVPQIIRATTAETIHRDRVYDRDPAKRWGEGRVTLLGDAAHPMTPDLGQGACQAIEDAAALARVLETAGTSGPTDGVETALRRYEAERRRRTAKVVLASRRLGRTGQLSNALACRARDGLLRAIPQRYRELAELRQLEGVIGSSR